MKDSGIEWIGEIPVDWSIFPVKRILKNQKRIVVQMFINMND